MLKGTKAAQLTDVSLNELSLVFKKKDGTEWAPRNPEALVLSTKGKPNATPDEKKKSLVASITDAVKAWYGGGEGPVTTDEDGAMDYNDLCSCITSFYYDLSSATYIADDAGRSAAVIAVIDSFLERLDSLRAKSEDTGKAGKRHSSADQAHLDAMSDAHSKLTSAVQAASEAASSIGDHLKGLQPAGDGDAVGADGGNSDSQQKAADAVKALEAWKAGAVGEDGLPENYADYRELCGKAGKKESDEPYGDVEYADPGYQSDKKKRYPIDTKEHAKAAWSYINKESNASKYSSEDLAKVKAKIKAACEKFGIEVGGDDDSKAGEIDMTKEELNALIADATTKAASAAATAAVEGVTAKLQPEIDAAKTAAETAKADTAKLTADLATANAALEVAKKAQAEAEALVNKGARQPSAISGGGDGVKPFTAPKLADAVKAANAGQGAAITPQSREQNAAANVAA